MLSPAVGRRRCCCAALCGVVWTADAAQRNTTAALNSEMEPRIQLKRAPDATFRPTIPGANSPLRPVSPRDSDSIASSQHVRFGSAATRLSQRPRLATGPPPLPEGAKAVHQGSQPLEVHILTLLCETVPPPNSMAGRSPSRPDRGQEPWPDTRTRHCLVSWDQRGQGGLLIIAPRCGAWFGDTARISHGLCIRQRLSVHPRRSIRAGPLLTPHANVTQSCNG